MIPSRAKVRLVLILLGSLDLGISVNKLYTIPAYHAMAQLRFLGLTVATSTTVDYIV